MDSILSIDIWFDPTVCWGRLPCAKTPGQEMDCVAILGDGSIHE